MARYYLEMSAFLKNYKTERGTDFVRELLAPVQRQALSPAGTAPSANASESFVTSYVTAIEANAIARRLLNARQIGEADFRRMVGSMAQLLARIDVVLPDRDVFRSANQHALRFGLRAPDAFHLATQTVLLDSGTNATSYFVTADQRIVNVGNELGLDVLDAGPMECWKG